MAQSHVNQKQPKFPALITGGLPVELELQIYSYLSVKDLANLESTCRRTESVIRAAPNTRQLNRTIIARETMHLRSSLDYVNFASLSIVTAWHRYINLFGIDRDTQDMLHAMPECADFIRAYKGSNPELRISETQVEEFMNLVLGFSDWCQYFEHGTVWTVNAGLLRTTGWEAAIEIARGETGEFMPGRYATAIRVLRAQNTAMSPDFIVQALEEVRAQPLQELSLLPAVDDDQDDETIYNDEETVEFEKEDVNEEVDLLCEETKIEHAQFCKDLRDRIDVPRLVHGFCPCIGTTTTSGERLLAKMFVHGDEDGLLFAALLEEVEICWMRVPVQ